MICSYWSLRTAARIGFHLRTLQSSQKAKPSSTVKLNVLLHNRSLNSILRKLYPADSIPNPLVDVHCNIDELKLPSRRYLTLTWVWLGAATGLGSLGGHALAVAAVLCSMACFAASFFHLLMLKRAVRRLSLPTVLTKSLRPTA